MKIDLDALVRNLGGCKQVALDALLDRRDQDPFDGAWQDLRARVSGSERAAQAESVFVAVSDATQHHEIASYITDDLDLIEAAERQGVEDVLLDYMRECYQRGLVPHRWGEG